MSDREDMLGEDFDWTDEPGVRSGVASPESAPSPGPRSLTSDLESFRKQATASPPRRLALLAVALAVSIAIVVAVVVRAGGNEQASSPPPTTAPTATLPQTPQQPAAPSAQATITVSPTITLRAGDDGPAVRTLQRALRRLGFAAGSLDGVFGAKTEAAVTAFQRAHGLTPDGVVGAATARALNRALARVG
jgi:hypothetical protein